MSWLIESLTTAVGGLVGLVYKGGELKNVGIVSGNIRVPALTLLGQALYWGTKAAAKQENNRK